MPDPAIAEIEERHQDAVSHTPDSHAPFHCPPSVNSLDWTLLRSHQAAPDGDGRPSSESPSLSMTGIDQDDGRTSLHQSTEQSPELRPSEDPSISRRIPHFAIPYHDIDEHELHRDHVDGSRSSRCPFVVDGSISGAREVIVDVRRRHSNLRLVSTPLPHPGANSYNEAQPIGFQELQQDPVAGDGIHTLRSMHSETLEGDESMIHARLPQAEGTRSATPGPVNGVSRARARLGLMVPSENTSHSQLRTPLNVRGPQTPNPATAIVAHDPAHERSSSPSSPEQSHSSIPQELKPFGRYTPSFLYHGSVFKGTQRSDRQVYNVEVKIQHVDMNESFMCGFLKIEGLTEDHPTLETYFEGEIIGSKYTFTTRHSDWGASEKQDMLHWNRFGAWKPLARSARSPDFSYRNFAEREHIFMRWKEHFLVPDHNVKAISGASFEGFYYICFNQRHGAFSGIYYHSKSEKWQQLELKHEGNMGTMAAVEFR